MNQTFNLGIGIAQCSKGFYLDKKQAYVILLQKVNFIIHLDHGIVVFIFYFLRGHSILFAPYLVELRAGPKGYLNSESPCCLFFRSAFSPELKTNGVCQTIVSSFPFRCCRCYFYGFFCHWRKFFSIFIYDVYQQIELSKIIYF